MLPIAKITSGDCAALQGVALFFFVNNIEHDYIFFVFALSFAVPSVPRTGKHTPSHTHTHNPCISLFPFPSDSWLCVAGRRSVTAALYKPRLQQQLAGAGHGAVLVAAAQGPSALRHRSGGGEVEGGLVIV